MNASLLIWVLLATTPPAGNSSVFWAFPGPYAQQLQTALVQAQAEGDSRHLISSEMRDAHLAKLEWKSSMGCIDDSGVCLDPQRGVLKAAGFDARVLATAERDDDGIIVTLKMNSTEGGSNQRFVGRGPNMEAAAKEAFGALRGRGSLNLTLTPKDASFRIDGEPFGQGSGEYQVPAGEHTLTVEALNMRTVEEQITIRAGEKSSTAVKMLPAFGRVTLVTNPAKTKVFFDGALWEETTKPREIEPGVHKLRVTADGYVTHSADVIVKSSISLDLTLKLRPKDPPWRKPLATPHADTLSPDWSLRMDLRFNSTRNGTVGIPLRNGPEQLNLLKESSGTIGFGFTLGWRQSWWSVDVVGLAFENGYNEIDSVVLGSDGPITAVVTDASRWLVKAGWIGLRYPFWRIEPYVNAGLGLSIDSYEGNATSLSTSFSISETRAILGTEIGLRYLITDRVFAGAAGHFDFWPDKRSNAALLLHGGLNFDPKGWF